MRVHAIVDELETARRAVAAGATVVQLRVKAPTAVVVTGGHGARAVDHLFDGESHEEIHVERYDVPATHGEGCTHSATLAALLAQGESLANAARGASAAASRAVKNGLVEIGQGEGPVNVLA